MDATMDATFTAETSVFTKYTKPTNYAKLIKPWVYQ